MLEDTFIRYCLYIIFGGLSIITLTIIYFIIVNVIQYILHTPCKSKHKSIKDAFYDASK